MKTYLSVYLGSLLLAVVITPIVIRIACALEIYDRSSIRKVHTSAIPRIGGVAIFLSATALVIAVLLLDNTIGEAFRSVKVQVITLLAAGTFILLVGFVDDLRGMRARHKLLAQVAAAVAMYLAGVRIDLLNVANLFTFHLDWLSLPITVFWIVAITNAVNMIDGLDGLAAGISAITCAVIAVFSFSSGHVLMIVLMLALLGSLSGFLFFNFNPARILMGDCGCMFLGFVLASASVMCATKSKTIVALALPTLALGLPVFDTAFSVLRRYLKRRGIMSPDRSHLHHLLLDMGLRHRHVVICMYALTAMAAGLGMFMILVHDASAVIIFFCVLLLLILVFHMAGAITLRETIAGLRRKSAVSQQAKQEIEDFEEVELYFRQAKIFDQWWQAVCFAADRMDFLTSSLPVTNRDGTERVLVWERNDKDVEVGDIVTTTLPVRDRRAGPSLNLEIQVHTNRSLESAGRRIALFGRLVEDYSVASLPNKTIDASSFEFSAVK
jgi:UDP-GlcNAc:undecaprenyl-phosphate GlcNAc-1-phosphate transferase